MSDDDLRAVLARIETRLAAVEKAVSAEHASGVTRGQDQSRIGERVARLEATIEHLVETLRALPTKAGATATAGVGALLSLIWVVTGGLP